MKNERTLTARNHESDAMRALEALRDPARTARTQAKMLLAARIYEAMERKGVSKTQLANMLEQKPSVITKWLSGTHNFTVDTLTDIERALGINLLLLEEPASPQVQLQPIKNAPAHALPRMAIG